jgi:hypothetical protein
VVKDMKIDEVVEKHQERLMNVSGVVGVGVGGSEDAPVIVIMVTGGTTAMSRKLPLQLDGYPVRVEKSGEITAF